MKKSLLTLALLAAPVAFGARTNSTTMDLETVSSDMHYDTNSNDRFDNRDTRTNSHSTPAYMGADQSKLGPDVTSNKYIEPNNSVVVNPDTSSARMSGTSVQDTTTDTSRMSGSSSANNTDAIETPTNTSASDKTGYSTQNNRMSGTTSEPSPNDTGAAAATGAAAGAAADTSMHEKSKEETATTTETATTHTTKKSKKAHKTHHKSGSSSDVENTPVVSPRSGTSSSADYPSSAGTPGSSMGEKATGSSTTSKAMNTESTSAANRDAATAAAGNAAASTSGKTMSGKSAATANQPRDITAQDTARNKRETELVQKIRSEITDNKDLSVNAHNVKIISQNGQIYLKGPVADANEKTKVEEIAKRIAGNTTVINQTTIDSRSGSSTHK